MRERGKFLDKSLVKMSIPKNILDFISEQNAKKYGIVPFELKNNVLYIACMTESLLKQNEIEDIFNSNITIYLVLTDDYNIQEALKHYYEVDLAKRQNVYEAQDTTEDTAPILTR